MVWQSTGEPLAAYSYTNWADNEPGSDNEFEVDAHMECATGKWYANSGYAPSQSGVCEVLYPC